MSDTNLRVHSYIVEPVDFEGFTEAVSSLGLYWVLHDHRPERSGG